MPDIDAQPTIKSKKVVGNKLAVTVRVTDKTAGSVMGERVLHLPANASDADIDKAAKGLAACYKALDDNAKKFKKLLVGLRVKI